MDCSTLPAFLEGELTAEAAAELERHLVGCAACQSAAEAAMQMCALGEQLSQRPDRPHAVAYLPDRSQRPAATRRWTRHVLGAAALAIAAVLVIAVFTRDDSSSALDRQLIAGLTPRRTLVERLPYPPLDQYREYDTTRGGPARGRTGEPIAIETLARLENRPDPTELISALIARGDLAGAERRLQQAGPGNGLDVERAILAARRGDHAAALALLDQVLVRAPRHAQAMWNRAVVLADLDLPVAAAAAFDACAALSEPGWSAEAATRRDELRRR